MAVEEWHLRVFAGPHRRRWCPVEFPCPVLLERPLLLRTGRTRPVACQVEPAEHGSTLHWIIESLAAGRSIDYRLVLGKRERTRSPRVAFEPLTSGVSAAVRGRKAAELIWPLDEPFRSSLWSGPRPLATITTGCLDRPLTVAAVSEPRRQRRGEPLFTAGPVFAAAAVHYHYLPQPNRPGWNESYRLRIYDGLEDVQLYDLRLSWHAAAGSIPLGVDAPAVCPVLRTKITTADSGLLWSSPGWLGPDEITGRPAPFLVRGMGDLALGILAASASFAFPPYWQATAAGELAAVSRLPASASGPERARLALGESLRLHWRLAVCRSKDPIRALTNCFLDFDCPPRVERLPPAATENA